MIKFFDLTKQYQDVGKEIEEAVANLLRSGKYILGDNVRMFEDSFANYIGTKFCIGVANGTDALTIALNTLPCNPERNQVITVANTYVATVEAIIHAGFTPVFVDIDPDTGLMDLDQVDRMSNQKTACIIPVHLYGQCVDMERVTQIARKNGAFVIEDACQAHGAKLKGRMAGSWGDLAAFSFYPSKNLGCAGDGGAITTNTNVFRDKILALRDHGQMEKSVHNFVGYNSRLDEIQACILNIKLKRLDRWNDNRRKISWVYERNFMETEIKPLKMNEGCNGVFHLYVIRVKERDKLIEVLKKNDVGFGIHYPTPIHQQVAYKYSDYSLVRLPITEQFCNEIISLPIYPEMSALEPALVSRIIIESIN